MSVRNVVLVLVGMAAFSAVRSAWIEPRALAKVTEEFGLSAEGQAVYRSCRQMMRGKEFRSGQSEVTGCGCIAGVAQEQLNAEDMPRFASVLESARGADEDEVGTVLLGAAFELPGQSGLNVATTLGSALGECS